MSQQRCSKFQKLYLELLNSSGDDPYIFENIRKSSTTFVYNFFPGSEVRLSENRKYQIYSDCETEQKYPIVNIISQVLLSQISSSLYRWKAQQVVYNFSIELFQILQLYLSQTASTRNWFRFLTAHLYHLVIFVTSSP